MSPLKTLSAQQSGALEGVGAAAVGALVRAGSVTQGGAGSGGHGSCRRRYIWMSYRCSTHGRERKYVSQLTEEAAGQGAPVQGQAAQECGGDHLAGDVEKTRRRGFDDIGHNSPDTGRVPRLARLTSVSGDFQVKYEIISCPGVSLLRPDGDSHNSVPRSKATVRPSCTLATVHRSWVAPVNDLDPHHDRDTISIAASEQ